MAKLEDIEIVISIEEIILSLRIEYKNKLIPSAAGIFTEEYIKGYNAAVDVVIAWKNKVLGKLTNEKKKDNNGDRYDAEARLDSLII